MTSEMMPEIEGALDAWQEGLSQFMYGPAERQRLSMILRAKLFAITRPTPALSAADADEIVRLVKAWVEAQRELTRFWHDCEGPLDAIEAAADAAQSAFEAKIKELRG